jgi:hypothetical protein
MTVDTTPVVLLLGADPASRIAPSQARRLAASLLRAARASGARIVDAVGGAVGGAIAAADPDAEVRLVQAPADPIGCTADLAERQRVVVVLLAGDPRTARLLLDPRTRRWSIVTVRGTGDLADQLGANRARSGPAVVHGDELTQLRERRIVSVSGAARVGHTVAWELADVDAVKQILARRRSYDLTARKLQRNAHAVEAAVLLLGVLVTFLALLDNALETTGAVHSVFRWTLIVVPVFVAGLIALAGITASGKRWLLLRAAAESMKREIFVWRTRTGVYSPSAATDTGAHDATEQLVDRVASIEAQLMGSMVASNTVFAPVDAAFVGATADDDGLSRLDAREYVALRVDDQLAYYRVKARKLSPQVRSFQVAGILAGAIGSVLAVTGEAIWIGLTTVIAGAIVAHMKQRQLDTTMLGYNRAIAALAEIRTRWYAVPEARRTDADFAKLVQDVEHVLEAEQDSWVRQMNLGLDSPLPTPKQLESSAPSPSPPPVQVDTVAPDPTVGTPAVAAPEGN